MPEIFQCMADPSVLQRQQACLQWQQQQQCSYYNNNNNGYGGTAEPLLQCMPADQTQLSEFAAGWPDLSAAHHPPPIPSKVTPSMAAAAQVSVKENSSSSSSKKRKVGSDTGADDVMNGEKRKKGDGSGDGRKGNESSKTDYIHVRARRGQATDSHSLAERVRREKISERMRYLQELVPGCNKIAGKASMLDEIINYVQSLQRQVEFLSMKLAAVNPRIDFNIIDNMQTLEMSSEVVDHSYLQAAAACCGVDLAMGPPELAAALRRTISAPPSESFFDSVFNLQVTNGGSSILDTHHDLQSLYHSMEFIQGRGTGLPVQSPQGNLLPNNLKMEM